MPIASTRPSNDKRIDREPEQREYGEGADQRDRDGERRDQRRAEVLQEDVDHQDDQRDRLEQCDHDLAYAGRDRPRRVQRDDGNRYRPGSAS